MGVISALFERRTSSFEQVLLASQAGANTATGKPVTALSSLRNTAVFACVRVLAESVASLPLILYQRQERGKRRAIEQRLYGLLHDLPNSEMTSIELRETLMGHLALWGNAYSEIQRDGTGRVIGLWPLRPDRVDVRRGSDKRLYYQVFFGDELDPKAEHATLMDYQVMHIRGIGYDGVKGLSPIGLAREAVGLALATEEYGARFFGNGARPGGVLQHPGALSDRATEKLRASWAAMHQGLTQSHRIAILEEGMQYKQIGIPPEDSQFLETRQFQVNEIARLFRVPPHMIGDLTKSSFSNIEHQGLEFVIHTLRPWLVRWEQAVYRDLLTPTERKSFFAEHLVNALLRGDIETRFNAYAQGRQNGWLSANDIRELENLNPVDGGDIYLQPLNMIPAGESQQRQLEQRSRETNIETRAAATAKSRQRLSASFVRVLEDAAGRVIRRESADVKRAARKYLGQRSEADFREWLSTFYQDHRAFWVRQIMPILLAYAEQVGLSVADELGQEPLSPDRIEEFIAAYAQALADRQSILSEQALIEALDQAVAEGIDPETAISDTLTTIEDTRPGSLARWESVQAGNAFAKVLYAASGVLFLRWVSRGETCPYCRSLNNRVVGIREFFLQAEEDFQPEGADRPLKRKSKIGHPPLHDGCDCHIVAN